MLAFRSARRRPPQKQIRRQWRYLAILHEFTINMHLATLNYKVLIQVLENRPYETQHRMKFEGLNAVNMKITVFCDVMTS
jgi:hypothetical protein